MERRATMSPSMWRRRAVAAALLSVCTVAACADGVEGGSTPGGADTSVTSPAAAFNDADVTFAQHMIVHHQQAVVMADLAGTRAGDVEVQQLAGWIKRGQQPEIDMLSRWLTSWGRPISTASAGADGHAMDAGSGEMAGMLSDEDMAALRAAKGAAFDKRFTTMMIEHHNGAIEMARQETTSGANRDAKALAEQIVLTQGSEVQTLRGIASRL
ncbi:MAG TPA: DUF305 domain-containing protein [Actinoplanes sp.]